MLVLRGSLCRPSHGKVRAVWSIYTLRAEVVGVNIELSLLAVMLHSGDFGPLVRDEITQEHFETEIGKALHTFICSYRRESDGAAEFPSLKIVRNRFDSAVLELPDPDPADTVKNLTHELRCQKLRSDLRQHALQVEEMANSSEDPTTRIGKLLSSLRGLTEDNQRVPRASLAADFADVIDNYNNGTILPAGIPWPWPSLTNATKGLHRKEFIVVAGRPKSRKTFTALRIGIHALKHHHCRVLVFSPEMPPRQVFLRCVAHLCDLPYTEFKDAKLQAEEAARMCALAEIYGRTKEMNDEAYEFHLCDRIPNLGNTYPSLDILQSTGRDSTWMLMQIQLYRPDIVIFDSFYRQRAPGQKKNDVDFKAITALSREVKDLVMETNIIGIGTHQLNRGAERGVGDLSSLALADAIGCDADGIFRVVTGKREGEDVSALYALGLRESNIEGVMIRNKPCYDYSEIGVITDKQQVADLMKQEQESTDRAEGGRDVAPNGVSEPGAASRRVHKLGAQAGRIRRPRDMRIPANIQNANSAFVAKAAAAERTALEALRQ